MAFQLRVHGEGVGMHPEQLEAIQRLADEHKAEAVDVHGAPGGGPVHTLINGRTFEINPDGTVTERT